MDNESKWSSVSCKKRYQSIKKLQIGSKISYLIKRVLQSNNKTYKGYARIVDKNKEPTLANAVSDLMFRKYRWNDG